MANTFINSQVVLWKTLARWKNNLKFARNVDHSYSEEFGMTVGARNKAGQTIQVPKPQRFTVTPAQAASFQGITNLTTPITMSIQANVAYQLSSAERYLNADHMYEKFGKPAADALSNYVDYQTFLFATQTTPNWVGTPGTPPADNGIFIDAGVMLDNFNCPMNVEDRMMLVSPQQMASAVKKDQALFHAGQEIEMQYRTGTVGEAHGFQWFKTQNAPTVPPVTYGGSPVVQGANQTGSTLVVSGFTAGGTLPTGTSFTIGSGATAVNTVNAQSRQDIGAPQCFALTAPVTLVTGNINLPIYPAIQPLNSAYQNVNQLPPSGAVINIWMPSGGVNAGVSGLAFHEKAFAVVYGKLDVPEKGVIEAFGDTDPETGCFMRYIMYLDGDNDQWKVRWDVLFGMGALYPEWAVSVMGSARQG